MTSFLKSFHYAWAGILAGTRGRNFRVMLVVAAGVTVLGLWQGLAPLEWAAVLVCCGLVLGLESTTAFVGSGWGDRIYFNGRHLHLGR